MLILFSLTARLFVKIILTEACDDLRAHVIVENSKVRSSAGIEASGPQAEQVVPQKLSFCRCDGRAMG
jgi:hypothetical protein